MDAGHLAGGDLAAHLAAGETHSFWWQLRHADPVLDTGPMWFVEVLLIYSLAYAAWRYWRRRQAAGGDRAAASKRSAPLSARTLLALAAAISVATVLVRPVFPAASGQIGQSHVWQWPQFVVMFGLGIVAAQRGWLDPVPDWIRRGCGLAALGGLAAFLVVAGSWRRSALTGGVLFDSGLHWAPLCLAAIEGPLAVGTSVWLLGFAQRRLNRRPGPLGSAMARSAYGAFLLQGMVLIGLMIALRPIGVPAKLKALAVAALGAAGSFALAWPLVARTRPVGSSDAPIGSAQSRRPPNRPAPFAARVRRPMAIRYAQGALGLWNRPGNARWATRAGVSASTSPPLVCDGGREPSPAASRRLRPKGRNASRRPYDAIAGRPPVRG